MRAKHAEKPSTLEDTDCSAARSSGAVTTDLPPCLHAEQLRCESCQANTSKYVIICFPAMQEVLHVHVPWWVLSSCPRLQHDSSLSLLQNASACLGSHFGQA